MIELHLHDHYSVLDGLNTPAEYMVRAKELGMTHLAQTNHGTLAGHREFQEEAKKAGITPILGLEAYISETDRFDRRGKAKRQDGTNIYNHIILLAQNETGLKTLNRLSQKAWEEGFYYKPRMDRELLFSDNDGIIVLSGCLSGMIAKKLDAGEYQDALAIAQEFKDNLGDRFFIEVQGHNPIKINEGLLQIADELKISPVATSDCHYARKEDLWLEEAMLILSTSPKPNFKADITKSKAMDIYDRLNYLYPDRTMSFQEFEIFLRDRESHQELFHKQSIMREDIYDNTDLIAERIGDYPYYQGLDLLPSPTNSLDPDAVLRSKALHGAKQRGIDKDPVKMERLDYELQVISDKNYSSYMLVIADIMQWCRSKKIRVGPGRGSAAGSMVSYCMYITDIDPVDHNLLFFRFIDPARDDYPDVDIDIEDRRRPEVKDYVAEKYGHAAAIATFTIMGGKSAIKDAGRVFRIPAKEVNAATKNNDAPPGVDYFDFFEKSSQAKEFNKKHPEVLDLARRLSGRISRMGIHASGIVLSKEPLANFAPIETAVDPARPDSPRIPYVALDMNQCADLGLIKMDFLGLKAMTIIDDAIELISQRTGRVIDLYSIDKEDPAVYKMLSEGYTNGVFQCSAKPYTNLLITMGGVKNFAELAASNALIRPGAMNTIGAEYIKRKNGQKGYTYIHKDTDWFMKDTYHCVMYQEQVMLMMTELAGMSMSDANKVRKIIGKKKDKSELEPFREAFVRGASEKVRESVAEKLWEDFSAHADYSFNKSHADAYSMVSYWTAWLKVNYPLEFIAAALYSEKDDDAFTDTLIEARRLGIKVLLPHVEKSRLKTTIEGDAIRLGLQNIKNIGEKAGKKLIYYRPYGSYSKLLEVSNREKSGISTRVISSLNAVGAAAYEDNPRTGEERDNLYEYLKIPSFNTTSVDPKIAMMFYDVEDYTEEGVYPVLAMVRKIMKKDGWARIDFMDSTGSASAFINPDTQMQTGQMYAMLIADNTVYRYLTIDELNSGTSTEFSKYLYRENKEIPEGSWRVIGLRQYRTKAGADMAYTVMQDHLGQLHSVMAFPQIFKRFRVRCSPGAVMKLSVQETETGSKFIKEIL
jgi:DNA polymerase-3 subunit alpha